ncbi:PAS domain S-box protein [Ramlibacter sp. MAHUQ-53]|uniref:PAS domain S-box protein n=1 Tax=unclassified Ramlibacter TaxID=2617605 RepID=UPI003631AD43
MTAAAQAVPRDAPRRAHPVHRYGMAVVWSLVFLGVRLGLDPVLGQQAPLIVLLAAPILTAWWHGLGPGLLATLVTGIAGDMLFINRALDVVPPSAGESLRLAVFVVYGAGFSWLIEKRFHALREARHEHEHLVEAQQQLVKREERMRQTLEASPAGMLVVNRQGTIELANSEAARRFGWAQGQLVGQNVDQLVPEPVRDGHAANREQFHARPSARAMGHGRDLWARRRDGTVFPVEIGLSPLEGAANGLVLASVIDISARRQGEQALRESEQRARASTQRLEADHAVLDAILRAVPAGIMLADAHGRILRSNPANERLWGRMPGDAGPGNALSWKGWWADGSVQHGRVLKAGEWPLARALRGDNVSDDLVEIEPFDRPGERRTVLTTAGPVRDALGQVTGAVVAQLDVTALVTAQAAERESAEMFRALADNIAQLAWMADEAGAIVWYNRRWFEYTGTTLEQMQGWGWQAVHHPDYVDRVVIKFRRHVATGEPWEDTFPMRSKDGAFRWFLSRAFPIRDPAGRIRSWFGTHTDITAQRQAEEALREADRRKDEFIAVLAHELRNPLAPVRSAVEILKRVGSAEPRVERTRVVIERQVAHMARLIDDLLDVSRIARGKLALRRQRCDLREIAHETTEDYRTSIESLGQRLAFHGTPDALWVDGDPVRLAQMLGNLLANASRFNKPSGRIEVKVGSDPAAGMAVVRVVDTGVGMDTGLMARLFDPFEQAPQDLARSRGGLGLGLALTKGLTELHGGTAEAASEGPGKGSAFTLRIPLAASAGSAPQARPAGDEASGLRILVVEDNPDAAATLGELLQLAGHQVELSADGVAGLRQARSFQPHAVISDLGLPGDLDGYQLARCLRADPQLHDVQLIAVSGYADLDARRRSAEAGFDAHLPKPADIRSLERLLRGVRRELPGLAA